MKKKKAAGKKALAAFLAFAMAGAYLPSVPAAAAEPEANLLLDFNFDNLMDNQAIVTDTAIATGGYTLQDSYEGAGKALHLDETASQWLRVTDEQGGSLLTGLEEMTVSYDIKNERTDTNWALYAAPSDTTQGDPTGEHYVGFLHKDGSLTVERYNHVGNSNRPANPSAAVGTEWTHIDAVLSETDTAIYVNGIEQSRVDSAYSLTDILRDTSILQIGKANWGTGEYTQASIDNLKIWDAALTEEEIVQQVPEVFLRQSINDIKAQVSANTGLTLENGQSLLPDYSGTVTWTSTMDEIRIAEDGITVIAQAPEIGEADLTGTLTAVITLGGESDTVEVPVTVKAQVADDDLYGYLMVHFVEDSAGYAEKIYLDISRGDNPEQWDPLNGRQPILASNLGTTGTRDPYITYNPETETYYIIATDLRVFGGDNGGSAWVNNEWGYWSTWGSTKMNVWESKDLIHWSDVRQFDVALDTEGNLEAYLGMMWAPEATWVDDYYGEGKGAFVVYWSSNVFADASHSSVVGGGSDIMWGVTTDFTQDTWEYGGVMLDGGSKGWIDTNIIRDGDKTYHVTKSHNDYNGNSSIAEEIIMQVTKDEKWWLSDSWTTVQMRIGADRYGYVEGPGTFKDHSQDNKWYLFVDDLPTPGYQPMVSTDLSKGWKYMDESNYFLTTYTKHGGVISLTKAQYDAIRSADATSAVKTELGTVEIEEGSTEAALTEKLPQTAEVKLAYGRGTSELPVEWDLSSVKLNKQGAYTVTGVVQSISSNTDAWVGDNGSERYDAPNKVLYSSRAIEVTAQVNVTEKQAPVLTGITITSGPDKTKYEQGDPLDPTGLVVTAQYSDGSSVVLKEGSGGYTVTGYNAQKPGKQTVIVSYSGMTAQFEVTVTEKQEPVDPGTDPGKPENPNNPDNTGGSDNTKKPGGSDAKGDGSGKAPQTGDTTNVLLPVAGMGAAVLLLAAARKRRYR